MALISSSLRGVVDSLLREKNSLLVLGRIYTTGKAYSPLLRRNNLMERRLQLQANWSRTAPSAASAVAGERFRREVVCRGNPVYITALSERAGTRIPTCGYLLQVSPRLIERTRLLRALRIIS